MSIELEVLQAQVLRLSATDRARLLDRLIASLDNDVGAEAAWDVLADQREDSLDSGQVQVTPLEIVVARLESRFPG
jgi:putative addiction module component (TIGR02574 family)